MAVINTIRQSTDLKMTDIQSGLDILPSGCFYIQYRPTASNASTSAAGTVFNNTVPTTVGYGQYILASPQYASKLIVPAESMNVGTIVRGKIVGSLKTNGTPNITFTTGMTSDWTNATYTALMTTGAKAVASTATAAYCEMGWEYIVTSIATPSAATVFGKCYWKIASTTGVPLTFDGVPGQSFGTFDYRVNNTIDAKFTWSASDANNAFIPQYAFVEIVA